MSDSASSRPSSSEAAAMATILPVLDRLRAVVETENREVAARGPVDYRAHTQHKNQGLYELTRLTGLIGEARRQPAVAAAFQDLSIKLETNRRLLGAQLRAAQTIANIVARTIRESQSDGTYSAYPWRDARL